MRSTAWSGTWGGWGRAGGFAAARAHGGGRSLGRRCLSASLSLRWDSLQDPKTQATDRCALPAVPAVANLMNGYIEERGVCF